MLKRLWNTVFRKNGRLREGPVEDPDTASTASATGTIRSTGLNGQATTFTNYVGIDVTDPNNFSLLTGIGEDEFVAQVLAAREKQRNASNVNGNIPAAGTITGIGLNGALFETFGIVKRLREQETYLKGLHEKVMNVYSFENYQQILTNTRNLWKDNIAKDTTIDQEAPSAEQDQISEERHRYYKALMEQLNIDVSQLRDFYYGTHKNGNGDQAVNSLNQGVHAKLEADVQQRREVKQELVNEIKGNLELYNIEKEREVHRKSNEAYTKFFWKSILLLGVFSLTSILIWYLVSPFEWLLLPVAILLAATLIFVPAAGFKHLFRLNKEEENTSGPNTWTGPKKKYGWLILFDIMLPLAIVMIILFINWNQITGYNTPYIILSAVFFLLMLIRAGICILIPNIRADYADAIKQFYEKKAFDRAYRQHVRNLGAAGLSDYIVSAETKQHKIEFLSYQMEVREKFYELIKKDGQFNRELFKERIEDHYQSNVENFNAFYKMTQLSPYTNEINDLGTVRKLLARLEYLYNLALGS
jgi:hypothetical protein